MLSSIKEDTVYTYSVSPSSPLDHEFTRNVRILFQRFLRRIQRASQTSCEFARMQFRNFYLIVVHVADKSPWNQLAFERSVTAKSRGERIFPTQACGGKIPQLSPFDNWSHEHNVNLTASRLRMGYNADIQLMFNATVGGVSVRYYNTGRGRFPDFRRCFGAIVQCHRILVSRSNLAYGETFVRQLSNVCNNLVSSFVIR